MSMTQGHMPPEARNDHRPDPTFLDYVQWAKGAIGDAVNAHAYAMEHLDAESFETAAMHLSTARDLLAKAQEDAEGSAGLV